MTYAAFHSRGTSDNDSAGQSSDEKRQDIPLSGGHQPRLVSRVYFWSLYRIWRRLTRSSSAARVWTPPVRASAVWMYRDRKSTRLNSSHGYISYAVFCLKKKKRSP